MSELWQAILLEVAYHGFLREHGYSNIPGRRYYFATGEAQAQYVLDYYASVIVEG